MKILGKVIVLREFRKRNILITLVRHHDMHCRLQHGSVAPYIEIKGTR